MVKTQTVAVVLRNISDEKSWALFRTIAQEVFDSKSLKSSAKLTRKQYYSRLSRMTRAGLVRKRSGRYALTTFGKIVYGAQLTVENALQNYWKLKAIDSLEISNELPKEERFKVIDSLVDNEELKQILVKGGPTGSTDMKTSIT
jgi:predicted transcriptional regulator